MKAEDIRVLVACEESQRVCTAFRERDSALIRVIFYRVPAGILNGIIGAMCVMFCMAIGISLLLIRHAHI